LLVLPKNFVIKNYINVSSATDRGYFLMKKSNWGILLILKIVLPRAYDSYRISLTYASVHVHTRARLIPYDPTLGFYHYTVWFSKIVQKIIMFIHFYGRIITVVWANKNTVSSIFDKSLSKLVS
jgi:hypothetical protein